MYKRKIGPFKSTLSNLILVILFVFLFSGCSLSELKDENATLIKHVERLDNEVEELTELITNLELAKKDVSDDCINLEGLKLTNGQVLYTYSAIPMSITINDIVEDDFRVVGTAEGIMIEYNDGFNTNPIAIFKLIDIRSVNKGKTTFPYNNQFVISYDLARAYQVEDEDVIAKIKMFSCNMKINGLSLYSCE